MGRARCQASSPEKSAPAPLGWGIALRWGSGSLPAQVIDIRHTQLAVGAAMVQPFFFSCASNHSIEPGWGTD
jgi:hypothetical protein